jgi:hypothetical protein
MTTQVQLIENSSPGQMVTVTHEAIVDIMPPLTGPGVQQENNPFHLFIRTNPFGDLGSLTAVSAKVVSPPPDRPGQEDVLLEAWNYTVDAAGKLAGTLVDGASPNPQGPGTVYVNYDQEIYTFEPAFNLPMPAFIIQGAMIEGELSGQGIHIVITGQAVSLLGNVAAPIQFQAEFRTGGSPPPPPTGVTSLQVSIISPQSSQVVDSDCFRLDAATGVFTSDLLSALGWPNGFWYAVSFQPDQPALFTAHLTALGTSNDGQPMPLTISYGGFLDQDGGIGAGAIVFSDGTPFAYQAQVNPNCSLPPPSLAVEGRAPSIFSSHLGEALRGYRD